MHPAIPSTAPLQGVNRRVGGLEDYRHPSTSYSVVIRRVGGLEDHFHIFLDNLQVIRRVGGLEVNVDAAAFFL